MLDIGDFIGDVTDVNGFGVKKDAFFIRVVFSSSGFLSSGKMKIYIRKNSVVNNV